MPPRNRQVFRQGAYAGNANSLRVRVWRRGPVPTEPATLGRGQAGGGGRQRREVGHELALEGRAVQVVPHEMEQKLAGDGPEVALIRPDLDTIAGVEGRAPAGRAEGGDELEGREAS